MATPDAQLIVVGAGASGLTAALTAASSGVEVIVFEKSFLLGGNTQLSSGMLHAGGTRFQKAAGVEDSPEQMVADILAKNGNGSDPAVTLALCRAARDAIHWLADALDYDLELSRYVRRFGQSALRAHTDTRASGGRGLLARLREAAGNSPRITVVDEHPAVGLLLEDDRVAGVNVARAGDVRGDAVMLACGGFGANKELLAHYCPEALSLNYIGAPTAAGEAITWAPTIGAALDNMRCYQGHAFVTVGFNTQINPGVTVEGGLIVNTNGERFAREDVGYSEFAAEIATQLGNRAVVIFDERIWRATRDMDIMRESQAAGAIEVARSLDVLADHLNLSAEALSGAVALYNDAATAGTDTLGRSSFGRPLEPPYYAALVTGCLAHTQGGLSVDQSARVLRPDGSAILGLYAGGGAATGVSGRDPSGYSPGNGLLAAIGFGLLAGRNVAKRSSTTADD